MPKVICLPWTYNANYEKNIPLNLSGEVTSWNTSDITSSVNLTLTTANKIEQNTTEGSDMFKVKIGRGVKLCLGDSGSAFVGPCYGRYSEALSTKCLYGVASNSKQGLDTDECSNVVEFTDLSIYKYFINKEIEIVLDTCLDP